MTNKSDKILAPIKQRVIQVIDFKVDNKKKFFENNKLSSSNFRGMALYSEVSGDIIAKILTLFNDINLNWLILGTGEMLTSEIKSAIDAPNPIRDKLIARQDQLIEKLEKENKELQNQIEALKKRQANFDLQRVAENDPKLTKKNK